MDHANNRLSEMQNLGIQVAGIGLGDVDYLNDTISLDDRAAALFDLPAQVAISRDRLHDRIHAKDRTEVVTQVGCLLGDEQLRFVDVQHRVVHDNGDVLWLSARKQVIFSNADQDGHVTPVSGLVAIMDVTAFKTDQQKIQFLLDELNHRSKNLLTIVQSLARRTFATGDNTTFMERFSNRISGLVRNQDALVSGNWVHSDLAHLVKAHIGAFANTESDRVSINGPTVSLGSDASQAIGMAIHELATNAVKYGALSGANGAVHVKWSITAESPAELVVTWVELGGPSVTAPDHTGFGQSVIKEMAAAAVGGEVTLEYRETGAFWQLRMPYSNAT